MPDGLQEAFEEYFQCRTEQIGTIAETERDIALLEVATTTDEETFLKVEAQINKLLYKNQDYYYKQGFRDALRVIQGDWDQ